jgi:putative transposase
LNGKLRNKLLNGELFYSPKEARIVIESWQQRYNTKRPHSSLRYRPPAPVARNRILFTTEQSTLIHWSPIRI